MIRAVVFDLDGTLADTEPLQFEAYRRVLAELGVGIDPEEYRREWIAGGGGPEYACRTYRLAIGPTELRARKAIAYRTLLAQGVVPRTGAVAAVDRLAPHYRLALATNSVREEARLVLGRLGLRDRLRVVVAREDYVAPKPAPDAYVAAARTLALAPAECVVVEDTTRGVRAGAAAGCVVVAVPNELTRDNDFTGAARTLSGLDDLTVALLQDLSREG